MCVELGFVKPFYESLPFKLIDLPCYMKLFSEFVF